MGTIEEISSDEFQLHNLVEIFENETEEKFKKKYDGKNNKELRKAICDKFFSDITPKCRQNESIDSIITKINVKISERENNKDIVDEDQSIKTGNSQESEETDLFVVMMMMMMMMM